MASSVARSYRAKVYNRFTGKQESGERWATLELAKEDQRTRKAQLRERRTAATVPTITLEQAWKLWLAKARAGGVLARGDKPYKPQTLDAYEVVMGKHVLPDYGGNRLADITTDGLQRLVSDLMTAGMSASSIRNTPNTIRAVYRDARLIAPDWQGYNPTKTLSLKSPRDARGSVRG